MCSVFPGIARGEARCWPPWKLDFQILKCENTPPPFFSPAALATDLNHPTIFGCGVFLPGGRQIDFKIQGESSLLDSPPLQGGLWGAEIHWLCAQRDVWNKLIQESTNLLNCPVGLSTESQNAELTDHFPAVVVDLVALDIAAAVEGLFGCWRPRD